MRKATIRGILVLIYLLVMGIALIGGLFIYEKVTAEDRKAENYLEAVEMLQTSEQLLGLVVQKTMDNSLELALSDEMEAYLLQTQSKELVAASQVMKAWLVKNPEVKSIHLMDVKGEMTSECHISMTSEQEEAFKAQFTKGLEAQIKNKEGQCYVGVGNDFLQVRHPETLYIARSIRATEDLRVLGYLYVFLDKQLIEEKLRPYLDRNNFAVLIADAGNHVVQLGEADALRNLYKDTLKVQGEERSKQIWTSLYHHAALTSTDLGLELMGKQTHIKRDTSIFNVVIGFCLINMIFLLVGIVVIRSVIVVPLEEITDKLKIITEEKDLSIRFKETGRYIEARVISETLNEMLDQMACFIKEGEVREKMQRTLELSVINHQINPHFLFNTLNSVNVLIAVEDQKKAVLLVKHLAKYYRACLSQEHNVNTIEQELMILREYIEIIRLKNPDLIDFEERVEEVLYSKKIPRMILQTLVENCIKYGIKTTEEPLKIELSILSNPLRRCTVITVRDNGKGMEDVIRERILQGESLEATSGFGLRSTIKRISLMYEIEAVSEILAIRSKANEYTEIKVSVPWEAQQESTTSPAISEGRISML